VTIDTTSFTEQVLDQASAWIVRLRSDQVTEQDQQDFALWLAESTQHQQAFDEMMVLWETMGSNLDSGGKTSISALLGKVSTPNSPPASNDCIDKEYGVLPGSPTILAYAQGAQRFPYLAAFASLAASVLVVALVFLASAPPLNHPELSPQQTLYATPVGKQQRFTLPDGSVLELNTDSQVAVSYSNELRKLQLLRGEAFFDVKPDPSRPFVVAAGAGQVTAVGTAFNIQLSPGGAPAGTMLVAVTEGRVAVSDSASQALEPVPVDRGQQAQVTSVGIGPVEAADLKLVSAWREKTLIFRTASLATALAELNRYLAEPVDVSDPSLSNLSVSGTFSLEEPEVTLSAIVEAFNLQSYKNPFDNKTRLYLR
jgi:transmembrane sensor